MNFQHRTPSTSMTYFLWLLLWVVNVEWCRGYAMFTVLQPCPAAPLRVNSTSSAVYLWRDCQPFPMSVTLSPSDDAASIAVVFENCTVGEVQLIPFVSGNPLVGVHAEFRRCVMSAAVDVNAPWGVRDVKLSWTDGTRVTLLQYSAAIPHCTYCIVAFRDMSQIDTAAALVTIIIQDVAMVAVAQVMASSTNLILMSSGTFTSLTVMLLRCSINMSWPVYINRATARSPFSPLDSSGAVISSRNEAMLVDTAITIRNVTWSAEASSLVVFVQIGGPMEGMSLTIEKVNVMRSVLAGPMASNSTLARNHILVSIANPVEPRNNVTIAVRDVVYLENASLVFTNYDPFAAATATAYTTWSTSAGVVQYAAVFRILDLMTIRGAVITVERVYARFTNAPLSPSTVSWSPTPLTQGYLASVVNLQRCTNMKVHVHDVSLDAFLVGEVCPDASRFVIPLIMSISTFLVINVQLVNFASVVNGSIVVKGSRVGAWLPRNLACIGAEDVASFFLGGVTSSTSMVSKGAIALALVASVVLPQMSLSDMFPNSLPAAIQQQAGDALSASTSSSSSTASCANVSIDVDSSDIAPQLSGAMAQNISAALLYRTAQSALTGRAAFGPDVLHGTAISGAPSTLCDSSNFVQLQSGVVMVLVNVSDVYVSYRRSKAPPAGVPLLTEPSPVGAVIPAPCYVMLGNLTLLGRVAVTFLWPEVATAFPPQWLPSMWLMAYGSTTPHPTTAMLQVNVSGVWSPDAHVFWDSFAASFGDKIASVWNFSIVSFPTAPFIDGNRYSRSHPVNTIFTTSGSPLIRLVDYTSPDTASLWATSTGVVRLWCVYRAHDVIPMRRVLFPPGVAPRRAVVYDDEGSEGDPQQQCSGWGPVWSSTVAVLPPHPPPSYPVVVVPTSVLTAVAASYLLQSTGLALLSQLNTIHALQVNQRCAAATGDANQDQEVFLSSVMDNPMQLSLGHGDPDEQSAVGATVGNTLLILLAGIATMGFAVGHVMTAACITSRRLGDKGHNPISRGALRRAAVDAMWKQGGWVSSFATVYGAVMLQLTAAAVFLWSHVSQAPSPAVAAQHAVVGCVAAVAGVGPAVWWGWHVCVAWRHHFPFVCRVAPSPSRRVDSASPRAIWWEVAARLNKVMQRLEGMCRMRHREWVISRRLASRLRRERGCSSRIPPVGFLPVFEPFLPGRERYFLVDLSLNAVSGCITGLAATFDSGAVSDARCHWSGWALLACSLLSVISAAIFRPHRSQLEWLLSLICGLMGIATVVLTLVPSSETNAETLALSIATCFIGLLLPILSLLRAVIRAALRVGTFCVTFEQRCDDSRKTTRTHLRMIRMGGGHHQRAPPLLFSTTSAVASPQSLFEATDARCVVLAQLLRMICDDRSNVVLSQDDGRGARHVPVRRVTAY